MPQQHPHPKPLRRGDTAVPPSPSREPLRVGTAALAAHAGPGIHSPAGAGTHQESPTGAGTHQKLPSRPTLIKKAPARGGSRCKGSGEREPPPPGGFSVSPASPCARIRHLIVAFLLTEWMTQDSREPNCATVYLSMPPSCADGWKSSRCTRGGVGAGSSLLVKRSHEQRDVRVYLIPVFTQTRSCSRYWKDYKDATYSAVKRPKVLAVVRLSPPIDVEYCQPNRPPDALPAANSPGIGR